MDIIDEKTPVTEAEKTVETQVIEAVDLEFPDPGVYPKDDDTIDIILKKPLVRADGLKIFLVKLFRAPNAGELNKAGGRSMLLQMYDSAHISILPSITEPQITAGMFKNMSVSDQQKLITGVCSFFID